MLYVPLPFLLIRLSKIVDNMLYTAIEQFSVIEVCREYFLIIEVVRVWRVQMMI